MSGNIFVSYRRDDSKHAAGRLVDRLHAEFGPEQLFMDVDSIELGLDFLQVINERVAACDVMLVIMGPNWVGAADGAGNRRLDNPNDFVRLEVEAALARDIRVIPVLVDGAQPPKAEDMPDSLAPLANRQATRLDHISFALDAEHLTKALARITDNAATPVPKPVTDDRPEPEMPPSSKPSSTPFETKAATPPEPAEDTFLDDLIEEGTAKDTLLDDITEGGAAEDAPATPSKIQIIGVPDSPSPKPSGGDAPRMTPDEARDVLRRTDSADTGLDRLAWFAALSPIVFGAMLVGAIALFSLQPAHFRWFGLPGEKVAYSLPLIGALLLWSAHRLSARDPASIRAKAVGGLLLGANVVFIVFVN